MIDIQPLTKANVDLFSAEISQHLQELGVSRESAIKARLMTEGIMLDWIDRGLENLPCEFRIDKQYKQNLLMLSVPGEDKTNISLAGGYVEMLSGLNLKIETYYAAEKNICNILIL